MNDISIVTFGHIILFATVIAIKSGVILNISVMDDAWYSNVYQKVELCAATCL